MCILKEFVISNISFFSYQSVNSTMDVAKQKAKEDPTLLKNGFVVLAKHQTAGRGTKRREWHSESQGGLYYTFVCNPSSLKVECAKDYQFSIAFCIKSLIDSMFNVSCTIKYPNDIFLNNKKLAGILLETSSKSNDSFFDYFSIGIGINLNQKKFPAQLQTIATSTYIQTQKKVSNTVVAKALTDKLVIALKL